MFPVHQARPRAHLATFCFSVHADNDVSVLPNVTAALAKRHLIPERMIATRFSHGEGELHVDFQLDGLDQRAAELLAQALRRMVCARVVLTAEK
jgi:hypothetical protein